MTCIVGLIDGNDVYIGGDSAGVSGLNIRSRRDPKVVRRGEFLFGYTSSFRMGQLLAHTFDAPKRAEGLTDEAYLYGPWIEALRKCFKDSGYAKVEHNVESGGTFLVGYRGRLFSVEGDFQIAEYFDAYTAAGCGAPYALGALRMLDGHGKNPMDVVRQALETAEHFSAGVRAPFWIERLRA